MFSSLTEHVELTFKVSTSNSSPSPLRKGVGLGVNAVRQIQEKQLYISSYSFYFVLQSLPEISGDIHSYSLRPYTTMILIALVTKTVLDFTFDSNRS